MATAAQPEWMARRISELYATDPQFAAARPSDVVRAQIDRPGLRLPELVRTVCEGYAERPALGQRDYRLVTDPSTGRTSAQAQPGMTTISYREMAKRVDAVAGGLAGDPVQPGDLVAVLGFTSVDYTIVDLALVQLGAVAVPVQYTTAAAGLQHIIAETEPTVLAVSVEDLPKAVEVAATASALRRLVVFDYLAQTDDHRDAIAAARQRLTQAGSAAVVETLAQVMDRGKDRPTPRVDAPADNPMVAVLYTSGSTGAPKGVMCSEQLVTLAWRGIAPAGLRHDLPSITLNFRPMSHVVGRSMLYGTLGAGGTAYFVSSRDFSTFLDDLALVRPTQLNFVPRVWDMLSEEFGRAVSQRVTDEAERAAVQEQVMAQQRRDLLGARYVVASTGSAPISAELKAWVEAFTAIHLTETYGSTESVLLMVDGRVQCPPVTDYKLIDVPELGYFRTDRPHPRGEFAVKSSSQFSGYYKRPDKTAEAFDADGYYLTGDILAEVAPGEFTFVDRRNDVLKLSQGEFVTVSKVEGVFADSPLIHQIYVYGNSARSYLVAVVVPTEEALAAHDERTLESLIRQSLQDTVKRAGLQSYEVPRDFLIETEPFTAQNGLLTAVGKPARPKLKEHYGERLERLYDDVSARQARELQALREGASDRSVQETVIRAAAALLGVSAAELSAEARFADLGGDSLSALTLSNLLHEIVKVEVPVGVIVGPTSDLRTIAGYVEAQRESGSQHASYAGVHGPDATELHAADLALDKFLDADTLAAAPTLPRPAEQVRTVLLTGATGFLGRYLVLQWLERLAPIGGTLICLVRAGDAAEGRARLDQVFDSGDAGLLAHYQRLAAEHLEVIAADKGEPGLGVDAMTWQRLADTVDLIIDPAALVNHMLPYRQLFVPNVRGTAELLRVAITGRLKPYVYLSTVAVGDQIPPAMFTEDADIRAISPSRQLGEGHANGYANSKWASEVLLRQANDLCGLPITVFRCDMILADTTYAGQLNLPDNFTRLILSLALTGIVPGSFYERGPDGDRQRAHYDGLPVGFVADAVSTLGEKYDAGHRTFHVANPHDDGIGLDEFADWLIAADPAIRRIDDYAIWLQRFETALRALPDRLRQHSLLPLLGNYRRPRTPIAGSLVPATRFRAAVQAAKIGADQDIPHISAPIIGKYLSDLRLLGLLG